MIVAHAQKVQLITKSNRKDDRHDARTLARLARIDAELSNSDLNEAIALYRDTRPKLVISHTAPSEGAKEILKDLNGRYFLNKHGDVESRTSRALQEMFEAHRPSMWYFGHFHINRELLIGETKFRCFAEMGGLEVVSCDSSVV